MKSKRIPQNAGKTRWPMAKIIVETNPTVSACLEAPQIPPFRSALTAHIDNPAGDQQPNVCAATKSGKLGCMTWVLAGRSADSNILRATSAAVTAPTIERAAENEKNPASPAATPAVLTAAGYPLDSPDPNL